MGKGGQGETTTTAASGKPRKSCYKNVPEFLPAKYTLSDITKTLPQQVYERSALLATKSIIVTVAAVAIGIYAIHKAPWYLLPLAWMYAGTAVTGMFVIGHDAGHRSLVKSTLANDIIGHVIMLPLAYPFHPWRIQHNHHHTHTNKLHVDNAWQPFQSYDYLNQSAVIRGIMKLIKGPLWFIASIGHWMKNHFDINLFTPDQQLSVRISVFSVYAFIATFFPIMYKLLGVWGIVKFWLVPWMGFHFWMSTMTMIHHTLPHFPFHEEKEWCDSRARLSLTTHCDYPRWVEFLCHDINVHVPHHVATAIPHYRLRQAHASLKQNWGRYIQECTFGWELLSDVINNCHIYDYDRIYVRFDEIEQKQQQEKQK